MTPPSPHCGIPNDPTTVNDVVQARKNIYSSSWPCNACRPCSRAGALSRGVTNVFVINGFKRIISSNDATGSVRIITLYAGETIIQVRSTEQGQ